MFELHLNTELLNTGYNTSKSLGLIGLIGFILALTVETIPKWTSLNQPIQLGYCYRFKLRADSRRQLLTLLLCLSALGALGTLEYTANIYIGIGDTNWNTVNNCTFGRSYLQTFSQSAIV